MSARASTQVVVLLGAPGSGKTTLGRMLGERGWRFREWERELLAASGGREEFLAHKPEALAALHGQVRALAASPGPPVVYETTGLSDAAFLDALVNEFRAVVVRLDVARETARQRTRARGVGEHLSDATADALRVWTAFTREVRPTRAVDIVIDTEQCSADQASRVVAGFVD